MPCHLCAMIWYFTKKPLIYKLKLCIACSRSPTMFCIHLELVYVTSWAKTRHISQLMKRYIRPEIGMPMLNCAVVKKWKRSVAWFPSYSAKCIADMECNFSRKRNVYTLLQSILMSPYTIVLRMCSCKKAVWKLANKVWSRTLIHSCTFQEF